MPKTEMIHDAQRDVYRVVLNDVPMFEIIGAHAARIKGEAERIQSTDALAAQLYLCGVAHGLLYPILSRQSPFIVGSEMPQVTLPEIPARSGQRAQNVGAQNKPHHNNREGDTDER